MNETSPIQTSDSSPSPASRNNAVQRCCQARDRSLEDSRARKLSRCDARELAHRAYHDAMPDLSGFENIRDFIACVTHGILSEDIHPIDAPKLLYAAQVAIGALRLEPKEPKRQAAPHPPN